MTDTHLLSPQSQVIWLDKYSGITAPFKRFIFLREMTSAALQTEGLKMGIARTKIRLFKSQMQVSEFGLRIHKEA